MFYWQGKMPATNRAVVAGVAQGGAQRARLSAARRKSRPGAAFHG